MRIPVPFVLGLGLAVACGTKKESPTGGTAAPASHRDAATAAGPGTTAATPPPLAPPARPLPPLEADPGGATGAVDWILTIGGAQSDVARALAITADDATLVVGDFEGEATFGAAGVRTSAGKSDAFVARVDAKGAVGWVTAFGSKNQERASEIAVAATGAIAIGGLFSDTLTTGSMSATTKGSDDLFVAGLDAKGEVEWLWTTGGKGSDDTTALAAFPGGGWIVAVSFVQEVQVGTTMLTSRGGDDAALIKLSAGGEVEWVTQVGGEYSDYIDDLDVDGNGNVFLFGRFTRGIDLGGGALAGIGPSDLFLARFDRTGAHAWSKAIGNPFEEVAGGLAVDQAGAIALTGSFDKELDFLGTKLTARGEADVFVARVSADGALLWATSFGGDREDIGQAAAVDKAGNVVVAGWFESSMEVGGAPLKSKGYRDGWVAKLGADGKPLWSHRFGDWDHDGAVALAIGEGGAARLAGLFRYKLDLGPAGPVAVQKAGDKFAKADGFIARLGR